MGSVMSRHQIALCTFTSENGRTGAENLCSGVFFKVEDGFALMQLSDPLTEVKTCETCGLTTERDEGDPWPSAGSCVESPEETMSLYREALAEFQAEWDTMPLPDRIDLCKSSGDDVLKARHDEIPEGVFENWRESGKA